MTHSALRLHALNCGFSDCPAHLLFRGKSPERSVRMSWAFLLLRFGGRSILIDTGLNDAKKAAEFGVSVTGNAPELLGKLGLAPEEITHVVITHHHFDHTGGISCFPAAEILMEERQYPAYRNECPDHPELPAGRLTLYREEFELAPLQIRRTGGHTPGSVRITFSANGRNFLVTGDECYHYRNLLERLPVGYAENPERNAEVVRALPQDAELLPFHDPELFLRYPRETADIVRIV